MTSGRSPVDSHSQFVSLSTEFPDLKALRRFCIDLPDTHPHPKWYCKEDGWKLLRERLDELDRAV